MSLFRSSSLIVTSQRHALTTAVVLFLAAPPQGSAQGVYERAIEHFAAGEYRSALSLVDSLLAQQPANHRLHYLGGLCRYQMADYQGSTKAMEAALRGDSLSSQYHFGLGRAYAALNLLPAARIAFEKAIQFNASSAAARLELVRVLCMMKQFDDAGQLLNPTATLDELLVIGKGLLSAGKPQEALEYAMRAVSMDSTHFASRVLLADVHFVAQRYDEAFALYAYLMMENQNSAQVARKLAFCYEKQGSRGIPVAILMMQKYMRLTGDTTAADLSRIGSWFYVRQQYDSSAVYYALATARDSTSADVRFNHGLALFRLGKLREAERELRACEQLSAYTLVLQSTIAKTLGAVLLQRKATGAAIQYYQKALRIDPTNADALYGLAASYDSAGKQSMARRWYGRFLDSVPPDAGDDRLREKVRARLKELGTSTSRR